MKNWFWIAAFLWLNTSVQAQFLKKADPNEARYRNAVSSFKQKRYVEAYKEFLFLSKDISNTERSAYSYYFAASAANELDKISEGIENIQQLFSRYPNWEKKDDAYYLGAVLQFKNDNSVKALEYLHKITSTTFQKDAEGLKQFYLSDETSIVKLKNLQKQFPTDRVVAGTLVNAINESKASNSDKDLVTHLMKRFNFGVKSSEGNEVEDKKGPLSSFEKWKDKTYYEVSVLLPFRVNESASSRGRSNQFVYDYYLGMQLAQKQLKLEKIDVRLLPYDVGNAESEIEGLLQDARFKESDLLVGPLHLNTSEIAAEFASKTDIVAINPLSTESKLLSKKYDNMYLPHATIEEQAKQVLKVAKQINNKPVALLLYGESSKDSAMAVLYEKELVKNGGTLFKKIRIAPKGEDIANKLPKLEGNTVNHIILFSTDARAGSALMGVLNDPNQDIPVIATSVSFDMNNTKFSSYSRDLYLLDTDFIDIDKEEVKEFRKNYYDLANTLPSVYSYQGYDQMLFFGRMMGKYKDKIKDGISMRRYENDGYLLGGYDFRDSRENTIFSVRKYQYGKWRLVDY